MFIGEIFPGAFTGEGEDDEFVGFIDVGDEAVADFDGRCIRIDDPERVEALTPIGEGLETVEELLVIFARAGQVVGDEISLHVFCLPAEAKQGAGDFRVGSCWGLFVWFVVCRSLFVAGM